MLPNKSNNSELWLLVIILIESELWIFVRFQIWLFAGQNYDFVWQKLWILFGQNCVYVLVKIVDLIYSKLWIFVAQNCEYVQNYEYLLIKIATTVENKKYIYIYILFEYTGWCRTLVEISTKLRHRCRSVVEFRYKSRPKFDQTSTKPRHPQCRSLVEVCSTYKWNTF